MSISESGDFNFDFKVYFNAERTITYGGQQLDLYFQLYARVMIVSNPSYLTMMIERCWATPTSDRNDPISYDIIQYRCVFIIHLDVFNTDFSIFCLLNAIDRLMADLLT